MSEDAKQIIEYVNKGILPPLNNSKDNMVGLECEGEKNYENCS